MSDQVEITSLVAEVSQAENLAQAIETYRDYAHLLEDYKFIFAAEKGAIPGYAVNHLFSAGAAVRSVFSTERVLVLDPVTFKEMQVGNGSATYPIDFSISLDTMAMSYLEPYMSGQVNNKLPHDMREVFAFIARDEVNVDPGPYIAENRLNLGDVKAADRIFEKLKSYEVLRTLDKEWLASRGEIKSLLTQGEIDTRAFGLISGMYEALNDQPAMDGLREGHRYMYVCLMKMAEIQIKRPRQKSLDKIIEFLDFCDKELGAIFAREAVIARAYFDRGQKLTFFGKIQVGKKDLLEQLKNMAWDLWHIRQLEEGLTMLLNPQSRYFFTALLTFDKRLIEIMDLYPLRSFAFSQKSNEKFPVYAGDWFGIIAGGSEFKGQIVDRFYSDSARRSRAERTRSAKANLLNVESGLESALRQLGQTSEAASSS
ncbi:MAG: hypothetical protein ABW069_11020 [Duganella sp.]